MQAVERRHLADAAHHHLVVLAHATLIEHLNAVNLDGPLLPEFNRTELGPLGGSLEAIPQRFRNLPLGSFEQPSWLRRLAPPCQRTPARYA
jgi:hypothetical protein